jgi:hypothetical protein
LTWIGDGVANRRARRHKIPNEKPSPLDQYRVGSEIWRNQRGADANGGRNGNGLELKRDFSTRIGERLDLGKIRMSD